MTALLCLHTGPPTAPAVQAQGLLLIEEWCPAPGVQVKQAIATRRAEREARYHQVESFHQQGLTCKQIARRLGISERTVRRLPPSRSGS